MVVSVKGVIEHCGTDNMAKEKFCRRVLLTQPGDLVEVDVKRRSLNKVVKVDRVIETLVGVEQRSLDWEIRSKG